ncbi:MAG: 3-hydroxyacyl-ACP dehydratase FabZ [Acidobacteriota bacterium]
METLLNTVQIQAFLPHRYPFLLVDRVIALTPGQRIVGLKNITINEPFFQGHFPGMPVMPGVLQIEAMAQTGGLLLLNQIAEPEKKLLLFAGIDAVKFRRPVVPGDTLHITMTLLRFKGKVARLRGEITVEGQAVSEAVITSVLVDRDNLAISQSAS